MLDFMKLKAILDNQAMAAGLEKYHYLMNRLRETNVSIDSEYQRTFREFYRMRAYYSEVFAWRYFSLLEQVKNGGPMSFDTAFHRVHQLNGTYEMSFSSKLVHTLDPSRPIWDDTVAIRHFGFKSPAVRRNREEACCRRYRAYEEKYLAYMDTQDGRALIRFFDGKYPDNGISDVKKLDFILSLDR